MKKDNTQGRRRTNTRHFHKVASELHAFFEQMPGAERGRPKEVSLWLTEMVRAMIHKLPEGGMLAEEVYKAIGRAWSTARNRYGYDNANCPEDRWIVQLHGELLDALRAETAPDAIKDKPKRSTKKPKTAKRARAPKQTTPLRVSHRFIDSWPEENIYEGDFAITRADGQAKVGALVWFRFKGAGYMGRLREIKDQSYVIEGSDGSMEFDRSEVEIEGEVIEIEKASRERDHETTMELIRLQGKLDNLERLPENEATRLQLESEIYRLENKLNDDEWPEVIGGE